MADHGGEVSARAVTADGNPGRIGAQLGGVCAGPGERGARVLDGRREEMLGRQSIGDGENIHLARAAQEPAGRVVAVQIADR